MLIKKVELTFPDFLNPFIYILMQVTLDSVVPWFKKEDRLAFIQ